MPWDNICEEAFKKVTDIGKHLCYFHANIKYFFFKYLNFIFQTPESVSNVNDPQNF